MFAAFVTVVVVVGLLLSAAAITMGLLAVLVFVLLAQYRPTSASAH